MKISGIKNKFIGIIAVFCITVIIVFGTGFFNLKYLKERNEVLQEVIVLRRSLANRMTIKVLSAEIEKHNLLLAGEKEDTAKIEKAYETNVKEARDYFEQISKLSDKNISEILEKTNKDFSTWERESKEINRLVIAGKKDAAEVIFKGAHASLSENLKNEINSILEFSKKAMKMHEEEDNNVFKWAYIFSLTSVILGLLTGCTLSFFIIRSLIKSIDISIRDLNSMADQVSDAAVDVSLSSSSLSDSTTQQASSLEETSAAVEEMNSMVGRNAESAKSSVEITARTVSSARRGQNVVENMMRSMEKLSRANVEIKSKNEENNQRFTEIIQVINEIGNKTKVINEIVFQTKLLSFNASVEAARAGEHGKGFSVVAEEVGKLAQMSGSAAAEITALLAVSSERVQLIINKSKSQNDTISLENNLHVEEGTKIARECGSVLSDIVSEINEVSQMIHSISEASEEQAKGISEINKAIIQLDQVTQINAGSAEQTAAASEQLSAQAQNMKTNISILSEVINGTDTHKNLSVGLIKDGNKKVISITKRLQEEALQNTSKRGLNKVS